MYIDNCEDTSRLVLLGDESSLSCMYDGIRYADRTTVHTGYLSGCLPLPDCNTKTRCFLLLPLAVLIQHRCTVEHVPRWIRHCRLVIHDRRGREIAEERAQVTKGKYTTAFVPNVFVVFSFGMKTSGEWSQNKLEKRWD